MILTLIRGNVTVDICPKCQAFCASMPAPNEIRKAEVIKLEIAKGGQK